MVLDKYGVDGIYQIYACGSVSSQFNGSQSGPIGKTNGYVMKAMGGVTTQMFGSYSTHQWTYFGFNYTGMDSSVTSNMVAKYSKNLVLWGDNSLTTGNSQSYTAIKTVEDLKKRNPDARVIYIGPEFVDTGVTLADEWIVTKPFADQALVAGMVYHMLDNTFDLSTGALKDNPWLDLDYLDTMVYGFFDSPAYGLDDNTGVIDATAAHAGGRQVPAVPAGRSYCSWILGNNENAKTYGELGASGNYTAAQFASGSDMKRWAPCSYDGAGSGSVYETKRQYLTPKTPAWASEITGIPEDKIKDLAELYAKEGPVATRWAYAIQKQAEALSHMFAHQALHIITKNVGTRGAGLGAFTFGNAVLKIDKGLSDADYRPTISSVVIGRKPVISCTAWHTAIKMAFADELRRNGYAASHIPNYRKGTDTTGNVYWDDGGTKAMIQWRRNTDGSIKEYTDSNGNTFYDWEGRTDNEGNGTPVYAGIRLLYNAGGNIIMNQHENSNDSKEMLECLDQCKYDDADTFCLVSIDNFMSATPRYSDYVLPGSTFWEQQDIVGPYGLPPFYTQQVITPPGEAKPIWDIAQSLLKTYESITGTSVYDEVYPEGDTVEAVIKKRFEAADPSSPLKNMTWEEYKKNPVLPGKPDDFKETNPDREKFMQNYAAANKTQPFIKPGVDHYHAPTNEISDGGYGNQFCNLADAPKSPRRFQVYSPVLVWQYENKFSKWHGYLQPGQRGQRHKDLEGHRFVIEIPVYYAYQDYFMEAYGLPDTASVDSGYPFMLTTTHDRYRSHSSLAENPILRELSHYVPGTDAKGNYKPANDYNNYSMPPSQAFAVNEGGVIPELNRTIGEGGEVTAENREIASYSEIWINRTDGEQVLGLKDGDLVQVENPIGAVRCVARLSNRCARGYVSLHQGCWYDPRIIEGKLVDVGGNCNTLMASQPSRIDHGNGQQSAMVKITKVNY